MLPENIPNRIELYNWDPQWFIEDMVTGGRGYFSRAPPNSLLSRVSARLSQIQREDSAQDVQAKLALMEMRSARTAKEHNIILDQYLEDNF